MEQRFLDGSGKHPTHFSIHFTNPKGNSLVIDYTKKHLWESFVSPQTVALVYLACSAAIQILPAKDDTA